MGRWDQIVEELPQLRRYAGALVGHKAHADDLVQATMERAYNSWSLFNRGKQLRPWLFKMLHNLYIDSYRRDGRLQPLDLTLDNPEALYHNVTDLHRDIESALSRIRPEFREVFLLVSLEGFSYREVSRILAIPQGTVMSRLSRARKEMRQLLESYHSKARSEEQA